VTVIRSRFAAAGALTVFVLAGCGAGSKPTGAASSLNPHDQEVKFAQCMRQHGVNMPDPKPGGGLTISARQGEKTKVDAAMKACQKYSPKGNLNPNDPRVRDHMLKVAQCLRQHGVNVPDPQPGEGGIKVRAEGGNDSKIRQAMEACRKQVPDLNPTTKQNGG
jgi:hypothetical protein